MMNFKIQCVHTPYFSFLPIHHLSFCFLFCVCCVVKTKTKLTHSSDKSKLSPCILTEFSNNYDISRNSFAFFIHSCCNVSVSFPFSQATKNSRVSLKSKNHQLHARFQRNIFFFLSTNVHVIYFFFLTFSLNV